MRFNLSLADADVRRPSKTWGVVNSYDVRFNIGLTDQEKHDLVEYLKSL
jgi:hypothetical protein